MWHDKDMMAPEMACRMFMEHVKGLRVEAEPVAFVRDGRVYLWTVFETEPDLETKLRPNMTTCLDAEQKRTTHRSDSPLTTISAGPPVLSLSRGTTAGGRKCSGTLGLTAAVDGNCWLSK